MKQIPKVYSQAQVVQFTSMEETDRQTKRQRSDGALAQDQAGLAARRVPPGRHRGRRHGAGHGRGGHRLLLALPQAGLQVRVHVFYGDRRKGRLTAIPASLRDLGCWFVF